MVDWMEAAGVELYFGYAGGAMWPLMDALIDAPQIEGIQSKHESHAVHMADIYYRVTGKVAPVFVTKGPGLMNCCGAVANLNIGNRFAAVADSLQKIFIMVFAQVNMFFISPNDFIL